MSCANTVAATPSFAALPRYCFHAPRNGVLMTNSSVSGSYVAVVPMEATSEPWPVSVIANAPGTVMSIAPGRSRSCCSSVPRCRIAAANRPHWTPALICSEGSAVTSSSKLTRLAPAWSRPPRRSGKARSTCP